MESLFGYVPRAISDQLVRMFNPMSKTDDIRMLEEHIKVSLIEYLRQRNRISKETVVISEFPVDDFARRADLVLISRDMQAFEIKSEADSLIRLQGQVGTYLRFFDKVTIVVAPKHANHVLETMPPEVAVWVVQDKQSFKVLRRGNKVPVRNRSDLVKMMRMTELSRLVRNSNVSVQKTDRSSLVQSAMLFPVSRVRHAAIEAVRSRYIKTSTAFWKLINDKEISLNDLQVLSPSNKVRLENEKRERERLKFWKGWAEKAKALPDDLHLHHLTKSSDGELFGPVPESIKKLVPED